MWVKEINKRLCLFPGEYSTLLRVQGAFWIEPDTRQIGGQLASAGKLISSVDKRLLRESRHVRYKHQRDANGLSNIYSHCQFHRLHSHLCCPPIFNFPWIQTRNYLKLSPSRCLKWIVPRSLVVPLGIKGGLQMYKVLPWECITLEWLAESFGKLSAALVRVLNLKNNNSCKRPRNLKRSVSKRRYEQHITEYLCTGRDSQNLRSKKMEENA